MDGASSLLLNPKEIKAVATIVRQEATYHSIDEHLNHLSRGSQQKIEAERLELETA